MKKKIIILDYSIFVHRAGYATRHTGNKMSIKYLIMSMILSCLKVIGVSEGDLIIVACDARNNWRKDYSTEYKSQRKGQRESSGLDWQHIFGEASVLLEDIKNALNWAVIFVNKTEADDVASVACRYEGFKNNEIVLVSYDEDWQMLWYYPHVKIFSQHPKSKKYKIKPDNFNVYQLIAKKIQKEVSDGLISPITTLEERATREMLVNLISLPEFVEEPLKQAFDKIDYTKNIRLDLLPGKKIPETFMDIYLPDKVVTYEEQIVKEEKKENRIKVKKEKEKLAKKKVKQKLKEEQNGIRK